MRRRLAALLDNTEVILRSKNIPIDNIVPLEDTHYELFKQYMRDTFAEGYISGASEVEIMRRRREGRFASYDPDLIPKDAISFINNRAAFQGKWNRDLDSSVKTVLANAMETGATLQQTQKALKTVFSGFSDARLENIARTETTSAFNKGRLASFQAQGDFVVAVQFMAIIDNRVTDICRARDGRIMKLNDPRLPENTPPMHFQCRSLLSPVNRYEWEDLQNGDANAVNDAFGYLDRNDAENFRPPANLKEALEWKGLPNPFPGFGAVTLITQKAIDASVKKAGESAIIKEQVTNKPSAKKKSAEIEPMTAEEIHSKLTDIIDKLGDDYLSVGLACSWKKWKGEVKESNHWIDGKKTKEKLDGTSTIIIAEIWGDTSKEKIIKNIEKALRSSSQYGPFRAILAGDPDISRMGEDIGEMIIGKAKRIMDIHPSR